MQRRIFDFLGVGEPQAWAPLLRHTHFNEHRVAREPLLARTEALLRRFYEPYNQLLAAYTANAAFLWRDGESLRTQLLQEGEGAREMQSHNQHGLERHFQAPDPGEKLPEKNGLRGKARSLVLKPGRFSAVDLPPPRPEAP